MYMPTLCTMKRILITSVLLLSALSLSASQDSTRFAALSQKLQEYYMTLMHESLEVQENECDFLIESASDSLVRQFVALDIYRHYKDSPVMGAENVAIHVFDRWFRNGEVKMKSNRDFTEAEVFAEFNRQSLIGCVAPDILLETDDGRQINIFGPDDKSDRFRILYFYDTDCFKCTLETIALKALLKEKDYPVDVYAVYVGDDRDRWVSYIREKLDIDGAEHFWDPEFVAGIRRKYGALQTPRIFLISPENIIIGRGLDTDALAAMLESMFVQEELTYGAAESESLFDGIFSLSAGKPSAGEVKGIADYIYDRTLAKGDVLMFRQMAGDYLYYLSARSGEGFKEGLKYHIEKNILPRDMVWTSQDDSLKVIGFASIMHDLLSKSEPGTGIAALKLPGELYSVRGVRNVRRRLDKLNGKENIIIFYMEGCEICAAEKKAALELLSAARDGSLPEHERKTARATKVFMVNVDRLMLSDPSTASRLMDTFDLSSLPFIVKTDSRGMILRRYLSLLH